VTAYAPDGNGDVAPSVTIAGASTGLDQPLGIVRDATGRLYVTTFNPRSVRVFAAGGNGNVAPIRVITGTNTHLGQAIGLAPRRHGPAVCLQRRRYHHDLRGRCYR